MFKPQAVVFLRMYQLYVRMSGLGVLLNYDRMHCTFFYLCDKPQG